MVVDDKSQLMAFFLAQYNQYNGHGYDKDLACSEAFKTGVSNGIDLYFCYIRRNTLYGIRDEVIKRLDVLSERILQLIDEPASKDMFLLLSGEHDFFEWLAQMENV